MVAIGLGETNPLAPNKNSDGSDSPDGRQLNRRVELKIVDLKNN
jgi:OOP family OmpA-OmpF porin